MSPRARVAVQSLAGAAAMITVVTLISRALGFLRWGVQAGQVGSDNPVAEAYSTANLLPNVLFEVAAGGALAGAVIPLLAGPIARSSRVEVSRTASALLCWSLLVLVPLGGLVAVFAGPLVDLVVVAVGGAAVESGTAELATGFLRVFALQIPLYGVGIVMSGVLQAHRRFFWPAAAPMFSSVVVIVAYFVYGSLVGSAPETAAEASDTALAWLAWGTTAGVAAMSLPLVVPAMRTGVRLRPTLQFAPGEARRVRALALAGIGGLAAQQVSVVAVMLAANRYGGPGSGTFPVYTYTQAVYWLPFALLAVPLATSAFPRIAERAAADDLPGLGRLFSRTTRTMLTIVAAGVAGVIAASGAVEAVFATFADGTVSGMGAGLAWMAPGLLGYALIFHVSRALYSVDHGRAAVVATSAGWFVVSVLAFVLPAIVLGDDRNRETTLVLLGAANTVGMTVAAVLLLAAAHRHLGDEAMRGTGRTTVVITLGGALGAAAGAALNRLVLPDDASFVVGALVGLLAGVVGAGIVLAVSWVADRRALAAVLGGEA
ncbi:murein biosynthesis integral membrane protein MurJ [Paraoerskovia marina]|uniref:murein biosynthesis integral membrane protein MurJ n=1 Tax=Paraoerskovia marina TaxID=545619 RepID=UPI0004929852|nr:lipid II flippase MurJ [Paraoerskovia marina]